MGCFSWMYADQNNEKPLRIGKSAYVPCPDGNVIYEGCYNGYGIFGGKDIYGLVALWNRNHIGIENLGPRPQRESWGVTEEDERYYLAAVKRYERMCKCLTDFVERKSDDYMIQNYGKDWLRELGIHIACYNEQNAALAYPIKICKSKTHASNYDVLPASKRDKNQGCY